MGWRGAGWSASLKGDTWLVLCGIPQTKGGDNCLSLGASALIREAQPLPLQSFQSERGT